MSRVFALLFTGGKSLDGFADRLNCRYTICILSGIAVLAMVRVLIGEPITCNTPSEFTNKQSEFAEERCWSSSSFVKPLGSFVSGQGNQFPTSYHQWIPLLLVFQALLSYMPKLFWNLTSCISGSINVRNIVFSETLSRQNSSSPDGAAQNMQYMVTCLGRHLVEFSRRWKLASSSERLWLLLSGNWTFVIYIAVRLWYVANVLGQLCMLNSFLGSEDQTGPYGFSVVRKLLSGRPWKTSDVLPTTILCDFEVLKMGITHRYSIMCSLPMNLWYEVVFLFLWFWFVFVAIAAIASIIHFVFLQFHTFHQERYCRLRLLAFAKVTEAQSIQVSQFVHNFFTRDAWFVVQSIGKISGDQAATELVCGLWENYIASKQEKEFTDIPS